MQINVLLQQISAKLELFFLLRRENYEIYR